MGDFWPKSAVFSSCAMLLVLAMDRHSMVALDLREMYCRDREVANWSWVPDPKQWQIGAGTGVLPVPRGGESLCEQIESELEAIQQELEPTDKSCRRRKSLRLRTSWVVAVPKST